MDAAQFEKLQNKFKALIKKGDKLLVAPGATRLNRAVFLKDLQNRFKQDGEILVAKSLAVEKKKVSISTLMTALILDLSTLKNIPRDFNQGILKLQKLIHEQDKPVVLLIDDAQELNTQTLTNLPEFIETINLKCGPFSILLTGHPQLNSTLETVINKNEITLIRIENTMYDERKITEKKQNELYENFETRNILDAVTALDELRQIFSDDCTNDGIPAPPELRSKLFELHEKANRIINGEFRYKTDDGMFDLALDIEDEIDCAVEQLEQLQEVISKLTDLTPSDEDFEDDETDSY